METSDSPKAERGGCITAFLIFMFITNPLMTIVYLAAGDMVKSAMPGVPDWAITVLAAFGIINLGSAVAVWKWKKIGIYGFWASSIIILGINLSIGISPLQSFIGLLGPVIITYLVKPRWSEFS